MRIQTTRFGEVEVQEDQIIRFTDGMIGFPQLKNYVLVESPSMPLVLWLQSMEHSDIAFPVVEPWFFKRDYKPVMNDADKISIAYEEGNRLKIFNVLTIPEDMTKMTVNLKAPILINIGKALATQVVMQDKTLEIRTPAHEGFSKAMSNFFMTNTVSQPEQSNDAWVAVNYRGVEKSTAGG